MTNKHFIRCDRFETKFGEGSVLFFISLLQSDKTYEEIAKTFKEKYGQSLSGLRNISQTGSSNNATYGMNPFLKSFQQSAGQSLGSNFQFKKQDGMFSFGSFGGK